MRPIIAFAEKCRQSAREAYLTACRQEVMAVKPGNVHRHAEGHGMTVQQFLDSALASATPLTIPGAGVGERIYRAVMATRREVGCNTNLGILLLCAPLLQAHLYVPPTVGSLRARVGYLLEQANSTEANWMARAIVEAAPGGLGEAPRFDVRERMKVDVITMMKAAQDRDRIARMYVTGLADLFDYALPRARHFERRWNSREWAITALYLDLLAAFPDTHVQRKHGPEKAREVSRRAAELAARLHAAPRPEHCLELLLEADHDFKCKGVNPGTTADLVVATVCLLELEENALALEEETGLPRGHETRAMNREIVNQTGNQ